MKSCVTLAGTSTSLTSRINWMTTHTTQGSSNIDSVNSIMSGRIPPLLCTLPLIAMQDNRQNKDKRHDEAGTQLLNFVTLGLLIGPDGCRRYYTSITILLAIKQITIITDWQGRRQDLLSDNNYFVLGKHKPDCSMLLIRKRSNIIIYAVQFLVQIVVIIIVILYTNRY